MTRIYSTGAGAALSSKLEVSEATYRAFFSTGGWNSIVRAGLHAAGTYFVNVELPKRFTPYARQLGYNGKSKSPLVASGRLRAGLLPRAYPEARATSGAASLIIRMPVPMMQSGGSGALGAIRRAFSQSVDRNYYANPKVNKVLKTITTPELQRMAEVMHEQISALIAGAATKTNRVGNTRMALTVEQRQSIAHTIKPQRSIAAGHK